MIPSGPLLNVTRLPLTTAGSFTIEEEIGYFHIWRFENVSDGSFTADGEVLVQFGGPYNQVPLPMGHNAYTSFPAPVTRTTVSWVAQQRRVVILTSNDARKLQTSAPAARIISNVGVSLNVGKAAVGTAPTAILPQNSTRQRAVIQAPAGNPVSVEIGNALLTAGNGIQLEPGQSMQIGANWSAVYGIAPATGSVLRFWEEY